jgi:hypothetical protein
VYPIFKGKVNSEKHLGTKYQKEQQFDCFNLTARALVDDAWLPIGDPR